jgi:transposase
VSESEMVDLYRNGAPIRAIVAEARCSTATLYKILRKAGAEGRYTTKPDGKTGPRQDTEDKLAVMQAMRVKGATLKHIGDVFGTSWQAVQQLLRKYA